MASTSSKLISSNKSSARSLSQTRLVANKPGKAPKLTSAKSTRPGPSDIAPSVLAKAVRWPKARPSGADPIGPQNEGSAVRAVPIDERTTRAGVSKTELKAQFAKLSTATSQIGGLKRALHKTFFEIGVLLNQIRDERLYEVKGYGSFESFVEREIDINKAICLKVARVAETIHRDQALAAGLDRAAAAVAALDGESEMAAVARPAGSPAGGVPLHKQ